MGRAKEEKKVKEPIRLTEEERQEELVKIEEKKRRKALRNEITHKLRFTVLERDNYTCYYCGKSPKTTPGTQLEIDHLKPLSAGGANELTNLVVACWECNEGKKDKRLRPSEKVFSIDPESIIEVAKTNNFDSFKKFLTDPDNEQERLYLYDYNDRLGKAYCLKNCEECVLTGTWWFKGCIQKLYRVAVGGMDEAVKLDRTTKDDEFDISNEPDTVAPKDGKMVVGTKGAVTSNTNEPMARSGGLIVQGTAYDKLKCDFCYAAMRCPKYRVGASCAFNFRGDVDFSNTQTASVILANAQGERIMRGLFFEKVDGGAMDKNVTNEIMVMLRMLTQIAESGQPRASIKIDASGSGKEGTGIVRQLLAGLFNNKEEDVPVEVFEDAKVVGEDKN